MSTRSTLPPLTIKGKTLRVPIIQGGMGVGVSLHPLARAVAREGGMGVISAACIDRVVSRRRGSKVGTYDAVREEVSLSRAPGGLVGVNIMVAAVRDFEPSVRASIDEGADAIICGAGLPLHLPAVKDPGDTALIPIVSSGRALSVICKRWEKLGARPDAVVLEGPLAGGHLGFRMDELDREECALERLLPEVKEVARRHGDFPVVVAGGIFTHEDIVRFLDLGASGVQMATRFMVTHESSATPEYKQAVLAARAEDVVVADRPGSPCGLPFRVLRQAPMYQTALRQGREPRCDKGYVLMKDAEGNYTSCKAKHSADALCICNGLLRSAGAGDEEEEPLYTVGANASRIDRLLSVRELMAELTGAPKPAEVHGG